VERGHAPVTSVINHPVLKSYIYHVNMDIFGMSHSSLICVINPSVAVVLKKQEVIDSLELPFFVVYVTRVI
jgi:hypothetical protein